jgi:hypothetical protein
MNRHSRRAFLSEVGRGMLVAGLGYSIAAELNVAPAYAGEEPAPLAFGPLEPLVCLLQETSIDKLIPSLVEKLRSGTPLRDLVAAAALANARTFGGEDYVGFHTMMALAPAYHMALELPVERQPLPVLKVLYRNTNRIQESGGRKNEVLHQIAAAAPAGGQPGGEALREAVRRKDLASAERIFQSLATPDGSDAFNAVLMAIQDATEVHRIVMPYRAWDLLDLIGKEHAQTLLRQSVHYCVKSERDNTPDQFTRSRTLIPKLFDQHHLLDRKPGTREADDAWVAHMSDVFFTSSADDAAGAAAAALAEGMAPDALGEALSLAANQLVLRDHGRTEREVQPNKPVGSVHGDSIGVHACDSANAWRGMAKAGNTRNTFASLILGAYQVALDRVNRGGDFQNWNPQPQHEQLEKIKSTTPEDLLRDAEGAIRENDQARACALVSRYGELGHPARPAFDLLLRFATSEDGALHAEKYYRTVSEEFAATRPAFRWRQLSALARVTASEFGRPAPGYAEACALLKA